MATLLTTEKFPTWALCYLYNADATNLNDDEVEMVDNFMATMHELSNGRGVSYEVEDIDNPYFTTCPAFGLACDVVDLNIYSF